MALMNVIIPNLKGPEVRQMPHFLVSERMLAMLFQNSVLLTMQRFFVEVSADVVCAVDKYLSLEPRSPN